MSITRILALAVAVSLAALVAVEEFEARTIAGLRQENDSLSVSIANERATFDSTRDVAGENSAVAHLLADSLRLAERRVLQLQQHADAIDSALGRERVARYVVALALDSMTHRESAAVDRDAGVRRATFNYRQQPFTIVTDVSLPAPPDSGTMSLTAKLDPLSLTVRVSCTRTRDGVREAILDLQSPAWAHASLDRLEQAPEVCQSTSHGSAQPARRIRFQPLALGLGRLYRLDARPDWGVFVGAALSIGR